MNTETRFERSGFFLWMLVTLTFILAAEVIFFSERCRVSSNYILAIFLPKLRVGLFFD
jgi:hypothetical protein